MNKKQKHVMPSAFLAIFALLTSTAQAAQREDLGKYNAHAQAAVAAAQLHDRLKLNQNELAALRSLAYPNGRTVIRHQQLYHGVPIWNEAIVEHVDTGIDQSLLIGTVIRNLATDLPNGKPNLSADDALTKAKATAQVFATTNEQAKLWVALDARHVAHFVYRVSFLIKNTDKPASRPSFVIDADTGAVLQQWEGIGNAVTPGIPVDATGIGGNLKTSRYEFGPGKKYGPLKVSQVAQGPNNCTMNNSNVITVDLKNTYDFSAAAPYAFPCFRNEPPDSVNGAYAVENDAHYFGNAVFDMYQQWFSVRPVSQTVVLGVHAGPANAYAKAAWSGVGVEFGDGDGTRHPFVTADIVAHEISHGFTEQNAGLSLYTGAAAAINESFSDMAGEALEYFLAGGNDFLVGAGIMKAGGAIRYFSDPFLDGYSLVNASQFQKDKNQDAHIVSGIFNKAFYSLATTPGWNTRTAFEVMVDANRFYWTGDTDFNSAACGAEHAARNRGYNAAAVHAAFDKVGVHCPLIECSLTVSSSDVVTGATSITVPVNGSVVFHFNADYAPRNSTAYWYGTKNNVTDASGQAISTAPGTYTYTNSPGAAGNYLRWGRINDSQNHFSCDTNQVTVILQPPPTCGLVVSSGNVPKGAPYYLQLVGANLPADAQGYWYGSKNGIPDVSGALAGPVPATYYYTNQSGWNGNYSRSMQIRSGAGTVCITQEVGIILQ